jgi:hypothetical protein
MLDIQKTETFPHPFTKLMKTFIYKQTIATRHKAKL